MDAVMKNALANIQTAQQEDIVQMKEGIKLLFVEPVSYTHLTLPTICSV